MLNDRQLVRTADKFTRLERQLAAKIFRKVGALTDTEVFETTEHLFAIPQEGWQPLTAGERHGSENALNWYRGRFTVPAELDGEELFLLPHLNGEALYYVDGVEMGIFANRRQSPVGGNHWVNRLCAAARAGETLDVVMEVWSGRTVRGTQPFQQSEGWSGNFVTEYTSFDVCVRDPLIYDTYFDLHVVNDLLSIKSLDDFRRAELLRALETAHEAVYYDADCTDDEHFRAGLVALREALAPVLAAKGDAGANRPIIGLVGHSHMDTAWLWTTDDTIKKCARTYSNQLNLMARYPEHRFVQSSACHSEMLRRHYPALFERVADAVRAGRYEPNGGVWVECDGNIPSGESMVRQFLWGQRYTQRWFGYTSDCFLLADTFGYSASIPQIMKGCGVKYFLTTKMSWNDTNRFPYDTFYWQGLDGTRVLTHLYTLGGTADPSYLTDAAAGIRAKASSRRRLVAYGEGDGGGGPEFETLETARRVEDLAGCPRTAHTSVSDFMHTLEREVTEPPLYAREMYLELHRGTLTNQHEIKRNNRKVEIGLHDLEFLTVAEAAASGREATDAAVRPLLETLLLNQFHDILPGTCIPEAHVMCKQQMRAVRQSLRELTAHALTTTPDNDAVTAVNTLSIPRDDVWYAALPAGKAIAGARCQRVTDLRGNALTAVAGVTLPPLSATALALTDAEADAPSPFLFEQNTLTTPFATITFDENGAIASFVDRRCGRELRQGRPLNTFLFGEDVPLGWDNWDIDADLPRKLHPAGELIAREVVADGAVEWRLRSRWRLSDKSEIEQDMIVYADSPLVRFDTLLHWQDDHRFLKTAFDTGVFAPEARFEMQFGHVRRSTTHSTNEELAQFEVAQHRFTDLSETRYGVAVLNDCKYGVSVDGGSIALSLHKGGVRPDYTGDHGDHFCTYAFLPHMGGFTAQNVVAPAYALNDPPVLFAGRRDLPPLCVVETVDGETADNVLIDTVKPCEDGGHAYILRLYEAEGGSARVRLRFATPPRAVTRTDMLEQPQESLDPADATLDFTPFHIETVKVEY